MGKGYSGSYEGGGVGNTVEVSEITPGGAREILQTNAAGTGAEWTDDISVDSLAIPQVDDLTAITISGYDDRSTDTLKEYIAGTGNGVLTTSNNRSLSIQVSKSSSTGWVNMASGTSENTSGNISGLSITPTYNQTSGTAANTDLLVNRTETSLGSGAQNLIDLRVSAASKFKVSNTGVTTITAANGQTTNIKTKTESITFNADPGEASKATTGSIIPAGAFVLGVTGRVTTANTGGATTMDIGIAAKDTDGFADGVTMGLGDTFTAADANTGVDYTALGIIPSVGAQEITVTGVGGDGNIDDMVIALTVHYIDCTAATS